MKKWGVFNRVGRPVHPMSYKREKTIIDKITHYGLMLCIWGPPLLLAVAILLVLSPFYALGWVLSLFMEVDHDFDDNFYEDQDHDFDEDQ